MNKHIWLEKSFCAKKDSNFGPLKDSGEYNRTESPKSESSRRKVSQVGFLGDFFPGTFRRLSGDFLVTIWWLRRLGRVFSDFRLLSCNLGDISGDFPATFWWLYGDLTHFEATWIIFRRLLGDLTYFLVTLRRLDSIFASYLYSYGCCCSYCSYVTS